MAENEAARLRKLLTEAERALRDVGKAALTVKPTLSEPYPDAPHTTPWDRFMEAPARNAYNLCVETFGPEYWLAATEETPETNHG